MASADATAAAAAAAAAAAPAAGAAKLACLCFTSPAAAAPAAVVVRNTLPESKVLFPGALPLASAGESGLNVQSGHSEDLVLGSKVRAVLHRDWGH